MAFSQYTFCLNFLKTSRIVAHRWADSWNPIWSCGNSRWPLSIVKLALPQPGKLSFSQGFVCFVGVFCLLQMLKLRWEIRIAQLISPPTWPRSWKNRKLTLLRNAEGRDPKIPPTSDPGTRLPVVSSTLTNQPTLPWDDRWERNKGTERIWYGPGRPFAFYTWT